MDIFWLLAIVGIGFLGFILYSDMEHNKPIHGKLCVSGSDSISIELHRKTIPTEVMVKFEKHHHQPHPCNHHGNDKVDWQLKEHHNGHHFLVITWEVHTGLREISWEVKF